MCQEESLLLPDNQGQCAKGGNWKTSPDEMGDSLRWVADLVLTFFLTNPYLNF